MIVVGTGHRPNKLGGYSDVSRHRVFLLALDALASLRPSCVITGMALGWDTALALAARELGVPFHAYVPFKDQASVWPETDQKLYDDLLVEATRVVICSTGDYAPAKMQVRNEKMIDAASAPGSLVLALWNGSSGGTANCLRYAQRRGVPSANLWPFWVRYYRDGAGGRDGAVAGKREDSSRARTR